MTPKHAARIRWPDRAETAENSIQDDESQQIVHISNFQEFRVDNRLTGSKRAKGEELA